MGRKDNQDKRERPPLWDEPVDPRTHYVTPGQRTIITTFPAGIKPEAPPRRPRRVEPAPSPRAPQKGLTHHKKYEKHGKPPHRDDGHRKGPHQKDANAKDAHHKPFRRDHAPRPQPTPPPPPVEEARPPAPVIVAEAVPQTTASPQTQGFPPITEKRARFKKRNRRHRNREGEMGQTSLPIEGGSESGSSTDAALAALPPGPPPGPASSWLEPVTNLTIRRGAEEKLFQGHPWVWANEVQDLSKLRQRIAPGALVDCFAGMPSRFVGRGVFNPHSLIVVRLYAREQVPLDEAFLRDRIRTAKALRDRFYPDETAYRLVFGESDGLPGLVVDRYNEGLVIQSYTLINDLRMNELSRLLQEETGAEWILEQSLSHTRDKEGLPQRQNVLLGEPPEEMEIVLDKVKFLIRPGGQKGGFFFDQRINRRKVASLAK